MDLRDRLLYHQIHPLKLATDITTAAVAAACFWRRALIAGIAVGFLPSVLVTVALVRWADLEPYAHSSFGRYLRRFMNRRVELARFAGLIPLWGGAWVHRPLAIGFGALWIVSCWLWGVRSSHSGAIALIPLLGAHPAVGDPCRGPSSVSVPAPVDFRVGSSVESGRP